MAQVKTKIKGEYTYPSEYSEVPEGALKQALNCNINRDSLAEPRRGFSTYGTISSTSSDRVSQFLFYKNTLFTHYGTHISQEGATPFTTLSGTYSAPTHGDSYVPKIKFMEANSNLYFTSTNGIQKLDAIGNTIISAGAPRGLDINLTLVSSASGFMTDQTQVAYRIVWGIKDANTNLILGSPSQRIVISNTSGSNQNVTVNSSIPSGITTSWFYQAYRTGLSSGATIDPNDEEGLVYESNPTSTDISNKYISFTDQTPDSLRGATIYTASSQQGIAQANDLPPSAKDLCLFKGMSLYANTIQKQSVSLTLLGVGGSLGLSYLSTTGNITSGSAIVTNIASTTQLAIGQTVTGTGIPAGTTILTVDGSTQVTLTANASATTIGVTLVFADTLTIAGFTYTASSAEDTATNKFQVFSSGTPAQNITNTANSLCKIINRSTTNTTIYAYYVSGVSDLPGKIFLEGRSLSTAQFTATATSHGQAWNPTLPTSGSKVQSTAEQVKNRIHVSKIQQPEACPRAQYYSVGSAEKAILRIVPLRDSTIIMKEDGYFRLTGTSPSTLQIDPLDLTTIVIGPETVCPLNNQVYAVTNQGVSTASDVGIGVISRPIEDQILPKVAWSNFPTTAFAVPYESERQYILFTPTASSDTFAKKQNVYNTFTTAWSRWSKAATVAGVNPADNKLYLGSSVLNTVLQERKALNYTDYSDEDITVTISAVSGTSVTLSSATGISVGDVLTQGSLVFSEVTAVDPFNQVITLDVARAWVNGAATIKTSYLCQIDFASNYMGNPGIMKHCRNVQPLLKEATFRTAKMLFSTDLILSTDYVIFTGYPSFLWGYFPWGTVPWGGFTGNYKDNTWPPADYQRCSWMNVSWQHQGAYASFALAGLEFTFEPMTERVGS